MRLEEEHVQDVGRAGLGDLLRVGMGGNVRVGVVVMEGLMEVGEEYVMG